MKFTPHVNNAREFLEIASDFGDPREIVREAISNSFDANATTIRVSATVDKSSGEDELIITISDDGEGMGEEELKLFFGLGFTNRQILDELGRKKSEAIGEKGHGTKIYFNSKSIEVETIRKGKYLRAHLDNPKKNLRLGNIPEVDYELKDTESQSGTTIIVRGYNDNIQKGFSHEELKDYLYWFTKFGSFEKDVGVTKHENIVVRLSGLGWKEGDGELLKFGHPFPKEETDIRTLRSIWGDVVSPLDWYVARWEFHGRSVIGMPGVSMDFVFYIEGDKIKRHYNNMIHERWKQWQDGQYNVEDRYGLWLCKDYIPIERRNGWVSDKSEWTKYHAFANCQDFRLTANRRDVGNTRPDVLKKIEATVTEIKKTEIEPDPKYQKYLAELQREQVVQSAQKEEKDFERRKKLTLAKRTAKLGTLELFEPRQESGVFSLVLQLLTVEPDLFGFKVVDYDTSIGYDLLVTKDIALDLNRASLMFVEIKDKLQREFNHSFKKLAAVICWDTKLSNDEEVIDLTGAKRNMKITPPNKEVENSYTKFMLVSRTETVNIEVFVLKEFLHERLSLDFKARTTE